MDQEEIDRLNFNHAAEAFDAFVRYARAIKGKANGAIPVLRIYDDGSGRLEDAGYDREYAHFRDLADLVEKLSRK